MNGCRMGRSTYSVPSLCGVAEKRRRLPGGLRSMLRNFIYVVPLFAGTGVALWGLIASRWDLAGDPTARGLFGPSGINAFYSFTYLLLMASILTVTIGTAIYLWDELFVAKHKFPEHLGGKQLRRALAFCCATLLAMLVFLLYGYFVVGAATAPAAQAEFKLFISRHDLLTLGVFVAFIIVDWLSYRAGKLALQGLSEGPEMLARYGSEPLRDMRQRARHLRSLSYAQIWLVDIAVVLGALASYSIHALVADHPKFVSDQAHTYIEGITAGFLAAHIIVSQIVFIILNLISHKILKYDEGVSVLDKRSIAA